MVDAMIISPREPGPSANDLTALIKHYPVEEDYIIYHEKVLGIGIFAKVLLCKSKKHGTEHAVKIIDVEKVPPIISPLEEVETHILCADQPGVVPLHSVHCTENRIALVMELAEGGDLFNRLTALGHGLAEFEAKIVVRSLLRVLAFMHANDLVYRDVKLENILLKSSEIKDPMLCDFGFSTFLPKQDGLVTPCFTLNYAAPEIISGLCYSWEVDCWAVGVAAYVLLSGCAPFGSGGTRDDVLQEALIGDYVCDEKTWGKFSSDAQSFVDALLVVDREKRLSAEEALSHPWLADVPSEPPRLVDVDMFRKNFAAAVAARPAASSL